MANTSIRYKDLTGRVFGRLNVIGPTEERRYRKKIVWMCRCECGRIAFVVADSLRTGNTKSCGCLQKEYIPTRGNRTHNQSYTPEYRAWCAMQIRCTVPSNKAWPRYGGRGITVCDRWKRFERFIEDMGQKPSSKHSLDRTDNDLGYSQDNCRWATWREQQRNRSTTRMLTFQGETMCITAWSERTGLSRPVIAHRLNIGWPIERALTEALKPGRGKKSHR